MVAFTDLFSIAEVSLPYADKDFRGLWLEAGVQHLPQVCIKVRSAVQLRVP